MGYVTWAARYAGGGWGTPALLARDGSSPRLAIDANGDVLAVGAKDAGTHTGIWASRFEAPAGWGPSLLIEGDGGGNAMEPQVAIDAAGHALVVWYQSDGATYSVWANRYQ